MAMEISSLTTNAAIASLSNWEVAGYLAVACVIVGVIGESVHEFTSWFKQYSCWESFGGKVSAFFLILALAGELLTQIQTNIASGQIIAFLNNEAAQANKSTKDLSDKFGDLNKFVQVKSAEIDLAKDKLKEGKDAFDKAHSDALEAANNAKSSLAEVTTLVSKENVLQEQLKKQLSEEKRSFEETKKAINPRLLTDPQKLTLTTFLRDKPKGKLTIYAYNGAFDSKFYSDQIAEAVKVAGWDVTVEIGGGPFWDNGGSGNHIHYENSVSHEAAKILYPALKASNIPIDENLSSEPVYHAIPDRVALFIGTKY